MMPPLPMILALAGPPTVEAAVIALMSRRTVDALARDLARMRRDLRDAWTEADANARDIAECRMARDNAVQVTKRLLADDVTRRQQARARDAAYRARKRAARASGGAS